VLKNQAVIWMGEAANATGEPAVELRATGGGSAVVAVEIPGCLVVSGQETPVSLESPAFEHYR
jgi:hypothetical protein